MNGVELLLKRGAEIDRQDTYNNTVLMDVAKGGRGNMVRMNINKD